MKGLLGKVFFLGVSIFVPVIVVAVPVNNTARRSKVMDFTADDMLQDMFDNVEDPLPVRKKYLSKKPVYPTNITTTVGTKLPAVVLPVAPPNKKPSKTNQIKTTGFAGASKTTDIFVQDDKNETFEVFTTPADYFSYPINFTYPITQKTIVVYDEVDDEPEPNPVVAESQEANSTEQLKVLWNSVGGAVEQIPFLPVQLNVPELIAAMANFLVAYLPFMNRITNMNHPREPITTNKTQRFRPKIHYYENTDFLPLSQHSGMRREYRVRADGTLSKKRIKNKKKAFKKKPGEKKERNAQKKIFSLPFSLKSTTAAPEDTKFFGLGNDQKEVYRWKNMPITRKKIRVADKEIFNFKNSDINNSPIMILNVPQRPITHFKVYHQIPVHPPAMSEMPKNTTQKPSMQNVFIPSLPVPIPGLPIPGLPFPVPIPGSLVPVASNESDKPSPPTSSISIPGIGGITIPGIGNISIGNIGSTKPNATKKDEGIKDGVVLPQPEKLEVKQRRKLKTERKTKRYSKRDQRVQQMESPLKNQSTAIVP